MRLSIPQDKHAQNFIVFSSLQPTFLWVLLRVIYIYIMRNRDQHFPLLPCTTVRETILLVDRLNSVGPKCLFLLYFGYIYVAYTVSFRPWFSSQDNRKGVDMLVVLLFINLGQLVYMILKHRDICQLPTNCEWWQFLI